MKGWVSLVPVCALVLGLTRSDEDARIEQLREWQEAPLDLLRADVTELALLPGLDPGLAEAVVGLRELGELRTEEDLLRVPGIGEADLEAMRPYVSIRSSRNSSGEWKSLAQRRQGGPADSRHSLHLVSGALRVDALARAGPAPSWRGAVSVQTGPIELMFGDLTFRSASGFLDRVTGRSRLAPAPKPRTATVRRSVPEPTGPWRRAGSVWPWRGDGVWRSRGEHRTVAGSLWLRWSFGSMASSGGRPRACSEPGPPSGRCCSGSRSDRCPGAAWPWGPMSGGRDWAPWFEGSGGGSARMPRRRTEGSSLGATS
jgi:hypothetical protein